MSNLKSYQAGGHQPTPEQRMQATRTKRVARDPITECLRDFMTCSGLTSKGDPPAPILQAYNQNTIKMVRLMVQLSQGDGQQFPEAKDQQLIATARGAQTEIMHRLSGLPRPSAPPDLGLEAPDESVTMHDRPYKVELPIPDADKGKDRIIDLPPQIPKIEPESQEESPEG